MEYLTTLIIFNDELEKSTNYYVLKGDYSRYHEATFDDDYDKCAYQQEAMALLTDRDNPRFISYQSDMSAEEIMTMDHIIVFSEFLG